MGLELGLSTGPCVAARVVISAFAVASEFDSVVVALGFADVVDNIEGNTEFMLLDDVVVLDVDVDDDRCFRVVDGGGGEHSVASQKQFKGVFEHSCVEKRSLALSQSAQCPLRLTKQLESPSRCNQLWIRHIASRGNASLRLFHSYHDPNDKSSGASTGGNVPMNLLFANDLKVRG